MAIFIVRTNILGSEGTKRFFYVETGHETVGALHSALRDGPVLGTKLRAKFDHATGKMVVSERCEFIIGPAAVLTIEPITLPFVDAVGRAA